MWKWEKTNESNQKNTVLTPRARANLKKNIYKKTVVVKNKFITEGIFVKHLDITIINWNELRLINFSTKSWAWLNCKCLLHVKFLHLGSFEISR